MARFEDFTVKRPNGPKPPKKGEFTCPDGEFKSNYPLLSQGLCDPWWDDGSPREPWTLKISMTSDAVNVTLNDKTSKLVCFTTAASVEGAFSAIEMAIEGNSLSWRKSKW